MGKTSKLLRKRERNGKDPSRASTKEMTVKLGKSFGCLTGRETLVSISKDEALPIGLWPVVQRDASRREGG